MSILQCVTKRTPIHAVPAMLMKPRECFRTVGYEGVGWYMRIVPTGIMRNSKLLSEKAAVNWIVVVDMSTGNFNVINGQTLCVRANEVTFVAS